MIHSTPTFGSWLNAGSARDIQVIVDAARSGCCSSRRHALTFEQSATRISRHVKAPRERVYGALADADAIVKRRVPDGMTSHMFAFEGRGGHFPDLAHVRRADRSRQDERAHGYIHGHLFKLVPN